MLHDVLSHTSIQQLQRQLQSGVRGLVSAEATHMQPYRRDFGLIRQQTPRIVVHATSEADVIHTMQVANATGIPITTRGAGHSVNGQSLSNAGILLVNSAEPKHAEITLNADQTVTVSGRTHWLALEQALNKQNRSAPVHTDYLNLSVGGTLSVGGYGMRSIQYGAQIDNVERLKLILPTGEAVWCSAETNADLFKFALAGLGQVGLIEQVVMRTVPYRKHARVYTYNYPSLTDLVASFAQFEAGQHPRPDFFFGYQLDKQFGAIYGRETADEATLTAKPNGKTWHPSQIPLTPTEDVTTTDYPLVTHMRQSFFVNYYEKHARMWVDYSFDYTDLVSFIEGTRKMLDGSPLNRYLAAIYILASNRQNVQVQPPLGNRLAAKQRSALCLRRRLLLDDSQRRRPWPHRRASQNTAPA